MSRPSHSALVASSLLAIALTLAACSDGGGGEGEANLEDSPLGSYFEVFDAMGDMTDEERQAYYDEQNRRTEELVASCMADLGFEYTPNTNNGGTVIFGEGDEDGPQWGTVEYAQQYGYGVFTWEEQTEPPAEGEDPQEWVDPNAEIMESMSESELQAWNEALWGAPQEFDPEQDVEEYEYNWEESGCYGAAQHEVQQDDPNAAVSELWSDPRFAELIDAMNSMWENQQDDPRLKEIQGKWADCMADAGHNFATPDEAANSIYEIQNSMWEDHADDPEYMGPSDEERAEYKEQEITLAVADYTCQDEVNYQSSLLEVQFAVEREFIEENKAALDEFKAAAEELLAKA